MAVSEHTLSEFLQHPSAVMPELARGPVVLHRRRGGDLVVMTREQSDALEALARVFAAVATGGTRMAAAVLPWTAHLSEDDRDECLRDLAAGVSTATTSGRFDLLRDTLYAWEATGIAAWDLANRRGDAGYEAESPVQVERPA